MLVGPLGGFDCPKGKVKDIPDDMGIRPLFPTLKQVKPALAPVFATQAILFLGEKATETGKSPIVSTGFPTIFRLVGLFREMANMDKVLLPVLTAKRVLPSTLMAD